MSAGTITMALTRLLSEWAARGHAPLMLAVSACGGFVAGMVVIYLVLRRPFLVKAALACMAAAAAAFVGFHLAPDGVWDPSLWQAACASLWTAIEDARATVPLYLSDLASVARQYIRL